MHGSRKPPTGESGEPSKSEGALERSQRATIRRDDRAEPDDAPGAASRVDVVNVDGPARESHGQRVDDNAASGLVSLRRELAKLNQQAAAVEKSLGEQRRESEDAVDRLERAAERTVHLEAKIAGYEAELATQRKMRAASLAELQIVEGQRDELARSLELAKATPPELTSLKEEVKNLRAINEETLRNASGFESELAELRKRQFAEALKVTDKEEELAKLRPALQRAFAEAGEARAETKKVTEELATSREDCETARADVEKLSDELALAKETRATELASAARLTSELAATRANEEALGRKLETMTIAAMDAEARAAAATSAHATLERSLLMLREEIAGAFSRLGPVALPSLRGDLSAPGEESSATQPTEPRSDDPSSASSPASHSVPPPPSLVHLASPTTVTNEEEAVPASIPPPTYASVPPQLHEPATASKVESVAPPTRRRGASAFPPAMTTTGLVTREELLAKLVDPLHTREAALELKQFPEWLVGMPPPSFVAALGCVDYDMESATFDLGRAWEREPLCQGLIASLRSERDPRQREHMAWLLKHFASPASWKAIADLVMSSNDGVQLRRWLLEALDRLAAGRAIGWPEVGEVVTTIAHHPDSSLRDGVVGILLSLERSEEKRRLLLDILRTDDDEIVLASAVDALASVLPMELEPAVVDRLLGHPSERVKRSVKELIERAKQAK